MKNITKLGLGLVAIVFWSLGCSSLPKAYRYSSFHTEANVTDKDLFEDLNGFEAWFSSAGTSNCRIYRVKYPDGSIDYYAEGLYQRRLPIEKATNPKLFDENWSDGCKNAPEGAEIEKVKWPMNTKLEYRPKVN